MFDKVLFHYSWDGEEDSPPSLDNLQVAWEGKDSRTGETITEGFINGMRVRVWENRQRMRIEGSLAKFLFRYTSRVRVRCNHGERNHLGFTSLVRIRMQRGVGLFPVCGQPVSPLACI